MLNKNRLVVRQEHAQEVLQILTEEFHESACQVGEIRDRGMNDDAVHVVGAETAWMMNPALGISLPMPCVMSSMHDDVSLRKKVCVLVGSDEPTSLQSLISKAGPSFDICAVIAGPKSSSIDRARVAGIHTNVIGEEPFGNLDVMNPDIMEEHFSECLKTTLEDMHIDIVVCISGFDIDWLDEEFRKAWFGRTIVVHRSLLPSYGDCIGPQVHQQVLSDGVRVSGCTAFFLKPRGPVMFPIILQETCRAYPGEDTATSLAERVVSECT